MIYVFDTSAFSQLFESYYRNTFRTLWMNFDELIEDARITSTREVSREIADGRVESLRSWAKDNKHLFPAPVAEEGRFVAEIFRVQHFLQVIEQKKLMKGGKNADPFIIARAAAIQGTVVTMEREPRNGARIPNICRHFAIPCVNLEGFMDLENWQF